jgi:Flp pilus assembly protein TadG
MAGRIFWKGEKGQAIVELALVLIIFLFVIFGITEFSRALYTYNTLVQSTRAAARWAVVNVTSDGDTPNKTKAINVAVYGDKDVSSGDPLLSGLTSANVQVSVVDQDLDSNGIAKSQKIRVIITGYQFKFLVPIVPDITIPSLETDLYTESMGATG